MTEERAKSRTWLVVLIVVAAAALVVIVVIGVLASIILSTWRQSVRAGNEAAAVQDMRTMIEDEPVYYLEHRSYGAFSQLIASGMLDGRFTIDPPVVAGYLFTLKVTPAAGNQKAAYSINADPQFDSGYNATGKRHFYANSTDRVIHVNDDMPASAGDPLIK